MSTREKAGKLLLKLYLMRRRDFALISIDDILAKASENQIDYYYYMICVRKCGSDD